LGLFFTNYLYGSIKHNQVAEAKDTVTTKKLVIKEITQLSDTIKQKAGITI
jgi:hypothetical protein